MFTEVEVRFLCEPRRGMSAVTWDMRASCPKRIMDRILAERARRLGPEFVEFRKWAASAPASAEPDPVTSFF